MCAKPLFYLGLANVKTLAVQGFLELEVAHTFYSQPPFCRCNAYTIPCMVGLICKAEPEERKAGIF